MKRTKILMDETDFCSQPDYPREGHNLISCSTVEELGRYWLKQRIGKVKRSTYSGYRYCVDRYILPMLGEIPLEELKETDIRAFIMKLQKQGLAETTIHSILIALKSVLRFGVQCDLLRENLVSCCSVNCHKSEARILTIGESADMKSYLLKKNSIFALSILLCRGTGIRVGELCGLKWGDIDFASNSIKIRRTVSRIPNPHFSEGQPRTILYIRTPKSHASAREVPIPGYLREALQAFKGREELYVLTGRETCTEPRNIQKKFKTVLRNCGMQECNFHAMRHGFATACLESGMDCKTVSSILGHSSTHVTMDFYMHTTMRQKQACVDAIEA